MPKLELDLPRHSIVNIFVPHDEILHARDMLGELMSHPWIEVRNIRINVAPSSTPLATAKAQVDRIDDEGGGELLARAYVGLGDRMERYSWSFVYINMKERLRMFHLARGGKWNLNKLVGKLSHYISCRLDCMPPMATLEEGTDGT